MNGASSAMGRRPLAGMVLGPLLALAGATASWGQIQATVTPPDRDLLPGQSLQIAVDLDLAASGEIVGGYGAALAWDPAVLTFVGFTGGDVPFDAPVVNANQVSAGLLSFADADPAGAAGQVNVLNVTFQAATMPCGTTSLDLELTSLFSADTFTDLSGLVAVQDGRANVDFSFDLQVVDPVDTVLSWDAVPGAVSYDLIRGDLSGVFRNAGTVHLGTVSCVENDSADGTTGAGAEPANPDVEVPPLGEGFFYVVRFHDGTANRSYGFILGCTEERIADSGDCP